MKAPRNAQLQTIFQLLAVPLAAAAGYFLWTDNSDWAVAFVVFAVCAAFLSYRFRLKERLNAATGTDEE